MIQIDIEDLRWKGIVLAALSGWLAAVLMLLISAMHGNVALYAAGFSALANLYPTLCAIEQLDKTAVLIRTDVDNQRQSADTVETLARNAAKHAGLMVERSRSLAERAEAAKYL